ncbi:DNA-dependent metalloprotease dvc-1 [Vespa crabro]|uniref:DNA-dependent metalloprotease dvc-1 n=1 Tax=Vespa crabro TaxID=7445 RepID=UPI001F02E5F5|nr:DNA-dependent metalloprotease dvc-1 [Vespa crabro]
MNSKRNRDLELALNLHDELNIVGVTENAIIPKDKNKHYKPKTLIDQTLEIIDPTPNIYTLFMQFNTRFFWNVLLSVQVKWSNRMTSCAGVCTYHPRNKECIISLSVPLLKLRPRKDLVETLLHEMIHGYLFLTNNNRDRDGHGPEFCKHMHRINKEAGTNITIYHTFHEEVKLYQQHWWRCNGPCHKKAPYFGTVRRAMNRAPGPSDFWWIEHQQSCGGQFIKIKEPDNFKTKNTKNNQKSKTISKNTYKENNLTDWLKNNNNPFEQHKSGNISRSKISNPGDEKIKNIHKSNSPLNPKINNKSLDSNLKKLGNNTNNVHGWGVGGPNSSSTSKVVNNNHTPKYSCSGQIGGSKIGKSNLLDKFYIKSNNQQQTSLQQKTSSYDKANTKKSIIKSVQRKTNASQSDASNQEIRDPVNCPICHVSVSINIINEHIDSCLDNKDEKKSNDVKNHVNDQMDTSSMKDNIFTTPKRSNVMHASSMKRQKLDNLHKSEFTDCSVCHKSFKTTDIYNHLDICFPKQCVSNSSPNIIVIDSSSDSESSNSILADSPCRKTNTQSNSRKTNSKHEIQKCLICNTIISSTMSLNDHLEECIGSMFNDESVLCIDINNDNLEEVHATDPKKYPCPVCMELFTENIMNEHLDRCLKEK